MNLRIEKILNSKIILDKSRNKVLKNDLIDRKYGIPSLPIFEDVEVKEVIPTEPVVIPRLRNDKLIALTFDDGPTSYTKELLEVLNRNRSRATFFILGNKIRGNESIIKEISACGNEIGIHGYSHKPFTDMHVEDVDAEIAGTYGILNNLGVNPANIVRPPYGKLNETIKEQVKSPFVLWNIDTEDVNNNKEMVKNKIINNVEPGSIIRMHDTSKLTVEVLKDLIPFLESEGYKFVTIDEMNKQYSNELVPGRVYAKIKDFAA